MRKLSMLLMCLLVIISSFATTLATKPPLKASEIFLPVGKTGKMISLLDLSTIQIKDFQELTGEKIEFFDRIAIKNAQRKLRDNINYDGSFNSKRIEKVLKKRGDGEGFQAGGFFLGFLLGLIGVLITYLINDDQKRNRVKWAWIGFAIWIGILGVLLATGGYGI
ncbi:MAG: hypothetical protein IPI78_13445 [Chitinophagaceae bacterium]|nr:hypothetical protein [Chitinophagaceae bacterium]